MGKVFIRKLKTISIILISLLIDILKPFIYPFVIPFRKRAREVVYTRLKYDIVHINYERTNHVDVKTNVLEFYFWYLFVWIWLDDRLTNDFIDTEVVETLVDSDDMTIDKLNDLGIMLYKDNSYISKGKYTKRVGYSLRLVIGTIFTSSNNFFLHKGFTMNHKEVCGVNILGIKYFWVSKRVVDYVFIWELKRI